MALLRGGAVVLGLVLGLVLGAEVSPDSCPGSFKEGREHFAVFSEGSLSIGAAYLANPDARSAEECVRACCGSARCNLALVERAGEEGLVTNCSLFDCLHRNKYVCQFVRTDGFSTYIRSPVYDHYLGGPPGADGEVDRDPIANAGPDVVVRPGQQVTLNGIESWDDKKIVSYDWKQMKGNQSVVMEKTQYPDQQMLSNLWPGIYVFQLTVTDSADQSDSTSVTVLVLTAEQADHHCLIPKKTGPCRGSFTRWYYNAASNKCETFNFGGCLANDNNYMTFNDCFDACNGTTVTFGARKIKAITEVCGSPCSGNQFQCSNGCCLDMSVQCDGQKHCSDGSDEENCERLDSTLSRLLQIPVDPVKVHCLEPPVTGPCRASFSRWYYNPLNQNCHQFTYGGCRGNNNIFVEKGPCMESCRNITEKDVFAQGQFERSEQEETHSGSVSTAVILVVVILALLALLGFYVIKKKRSQSQRQRVPKANPVVTLSEDTENLVYKPTTTSP